MINQTREVGDSDLTKATSTAGLGRTCLKQHLRFYLKMKFFTRTAVMSDDSRAVQWDSAKLQATDWSESVVP